jgi:hypothetical protein
MRFTLLEQAIAKREAARAKREADREARKVAQGRQLIRALLQDKELGRPLTSVWPQTNQKTKVKVAARAAARELLQRVSRWRAGARR